MFETHEFHREGRKFQDENMTITPVYLYPAGHTPTHDRDDSSLAGGTPSLKRKSEDDQRTPTGYALKKLLLHHMFGSGGRTNSPSQQPAADVLREQEDSIMVMPARSDSEITIAPISTSGISAEPTASSEESGESVSNGTEAGQSAPEESAATEAKRVNEAKKLAESVRHMAQRAELKRLGMNRLPQTPRNPVALCYVCEGPTVPGKFDAVAARNLGIKPGPDCGRLAKGESVTLENGTVVEPHQCVGPPRPGAIFAILDCPSPAYLNSLLQSEVLSNLREENRLKYIVHILGDGVMEDQRFVDWAQTFPKTTQHIIVSRNYNSFHYNFHASATVTQQLNALDSAVFPLSFGKDEPSKTLEGFPSNMKSAEPLESFQIEPKMKQEKVWKVPKLSDGLKIAGFDAATLALRTSGAMDLAEEEGVALEGVEVIPLGTGAAIPGKYRNVSSTLVMMPTGNLLLDGGEGTLGQLLRHFGPEGLEDVLGRLRVIFVSHLHADHHLGIIRVLKARRQVVGAQNDAPVYLVGPTRFGVWLEEYSDCEDFGMDQLRFVDSERMRWRPGYVNESNDPKVNELKQSLSLIDIRTVGVQHCPSAYALIAETTAGFKMGFSGDCRPSTDFSEAGKDATLLIHEATLDDEMQEEAVAKRHCTIGEAIEVAKRMKARNLLLTHFSQRYPKIPIINLNEPSSVQPVENGTANGASEEHRPNVAIAFDLMRIRMASFRKLELYTPALQALFTYIADQEDATTTA
ncbi:hypothetical protein HK097_005105 [Rhizophlyctis rosea]|uniref:ribonuclease Z n=1 Tax=Rhizophlyctis rosea TaxID=64517 RepID=A0AAD5SM83_9FUNG|nr:hypothetical protein HK097_005105 [Rhizophlyctis rosea]